MHLPGKFNVYNALGSIAAALALNIPLDVAIRGVEGLKSVPGRSEKISCSLGSTIVIDYAHTPDGIENILRAAREYTKGRLITVFGCGGDRDRGKRPLMGKAAGELSDFCIITSDNPRSEEPQDIINDILPGIDTTKCKYVIIEDRRKAIEYAIKNQRRVM
ncbi:cyanophycin synthetase [Caloramator sp. mosi_1]|uniref:glutamate ligase domain-containing protein n=1 Tax=Caloramator sp. mosi_1 TaxID=3023090 RepID=UPI00235E3C4A|nr:cyanophycin synthetase [Caloramator sp. mosi_1]WDC85887.1 cyanophycin synthetase [Caloramator sp. mosi_1]